MGLHSPGSVIAGRYEIVREIARGAMGIVYLARHELSRKEVALKLLDPRASTSEAAMARFEREVSVRAETKHEGIVDVLDAGVAEARRRVRRRPRLLARPVDLLVGGP